MAAPLQTTELFHLLASTDDKKGILQDIKTTLMSSLIPESNVMNATAFETLFGCLNTSDGWVEQIFTSDHNINNFFVKTLLNYTFFKRSWHH